MLLGRVEGFDSWVAGTEVAGDKLWLREHDSVTEFDIQLFYGRTSARGLRELGVEAIDRLQTAMILAAFNRKIDAASSIIMHEPPPSPYMVDELVDGLGKLTLAGRRAVLFALEMKMEPEKVATLTWSTLLMSGVVATMSPLAREIVEAADEARHIRLPYVFWEWCDPVTASPLIRLEDQATEAFKATWPALVQRYARMAYIDRGENSTSFLDLAQQFQRPH